jgi:hypothetical protein
VNSQVKISFESEVYTDHVGQTRRYRSVRQTLTGKRARLAQKQSGPFDSVSVATATTQREPFQFSVAAAKSGRIVAGAVASSDPPSRALAVWCRSGHRSLPSSPLLSHARGKLTAHYTTTYYRPKTLYFPRPLCCRRPWALSITDLEPVTARTLPFHLQAPQENAVLLRFPI